VLRLLWVLPILALGLQDPHVLPESPRVGSLVRVALEGPGEATVRMPDRTIQLVIQRDGISFLPLQAGEVVIEVKDREPIRLQIGPEEPPAPIPPGMLSRDDQKRVMREIADLWADPEPDLKRIGELQGYLPRFLPPYNSRDRERFDAFAREFTEGLASMKDKREFEARHCIRCHLYFRWNVVPDISNYPRLRDE